MTVIRRSSPSKTGSLVALTLFLMAYLAVVAVLFVPQHMAGPKSPVHASILR